VPKIWAEFRDPLGQLRSCHSNPRLAVAQGKSGQSPPNISHLIEPYVFFKPSRPRPCAQPESRHSRAEKSSQVNAPS
jgi:hypothetical protein